MLDRGPAVTECRLLDDFFGWFVQFLLAVLTFLTLLLKRNFFDQILRPWAVFWRDSSKQGLSAVVAHLLNLLFALVLKEYGNPCKWYFINFIVDNVIGVFLNVLCLQVLERLVGGKFVAGFYEVDANTDATSFKAYFTDRLYLAQLWSWTLIVILVKAALFFGLVVPLKHPLYVVGSVLLEPFESFPRLQLVFVMVIVPVSLNVLQFWVQDNFLMGVDAKREREEQRSREAHTTNRKTSDASDADETTTLL